MKFQYLKNKENILKTSRKKEKNTQEIKNQNSTGLFTATSRKQKQWEKNAFHILRGNDFQSRITYTSKLSIKYMSRKKYF